MANDFSDIRVLDLTRVLAGPLCAQLLGDLGAEVIKIERPGAGDDARRYGPVYLKDSAGRDTRESPTYLSVNRNKKSLTLDISKPRGQELLRELAAVSDVLVENYKVGDLARYGLDYDSLKTVNPGLIYCSVTGYGQTGPYAERPGYDFIFQAMGGLMSITGHPQGVPGAGPMRVGFSMVDVMTGQYAAMAILYALYRRDAAPGAAAMDRARRQGQHIDIAMFDSLVASFADVTQRYLLSGQVPQRMGNTGAAVVPCQTFDCSDGPIMIIAGNDLQFRKLCETLGQPAIAVDGRFAGVAERSQNRASLTAALNDLTLRWKVGDLATALHAAQVPAGPVNTVAQAFEDPQIRHRGMLVDVPHPLSGSVKLVKNPIRFSETPIEEYAAPPLLGADTEAILTDLLHLDEAVIASLRQTNIV